MCYGRSSTPGSFCSGIDGWGRVSFVQRCDTPVWTKKTNVMELDEFGPDYHQLSINNRIGSPKSCTSRLVNRAPSAPSTTRWS